MDINVKGENFKIPWEYLVLPCLIILLIIVLVISNFSAIRRLWISYTDEIYEATPTSEISTPYPDNKSQNSETQQNNNETDNTETQPTDENIQEVLIININTATKDDLISLPYIGGVKAQAIIDYRTTNGPFKTIEDIVNVKGIGPKTLEKLRPYITV